MRVLQVTGSFNHLIMAEIGRTLLEEGHEDLLLISGNASLLREALPGRVVVAPAAHAGPDARALRRVLDEFRPDAVLYHEPPPGALTEVAALGVTAPVTAFVHTVICPGAKLLRRNDALCGARMSLGGCLTRWYAGPCGSDRSPRAAWRDVRAALRRAEEMKRLPRVLVASDFMRGHLLHEGFDPARVVVVDPGYRLEPGTPAPRPPSARRRLLVMARLTYAKGVQNLLRAVALAGGDGFEVEIVGDGYYRPALERLAAELALPHVSFSGWKDGEEVAAAYRRADLVVVPSLWPEPYGTVPAEATACGVPVLVSDRGGLPEWRDVLPSVGVVDVTDLPAFARALADASPPGMPEARRGQRPTAGAVLSALVSPPETRRPAALTDVR